IQRIIHLGTKEEDLVLDFFMGSSTTQAVAHKMNRQYIGIEQMDYIKEVSIPRLQRVIEGEQGGISKEFKWQGGGSFVYVELHNLNHKFIEDIQAADTNDSLNDILENIKKNSYLNLVVALEKITLNDNEYRELSLKERCINSNFGYESVISQLFRDRRQPI